MSTLISHHKAGPASTLGRAWAAVSVRAGVAMAIVMAAALAYWLWYGLFLRNVDIDDAISILAIQGILQHGYPLLPSQDIYDRAFVPNYIVAGSVGLLGMNQLSLMLPSLILGLGSLFLVYRIAKDIIGIPWLGVVAGIFLVALEMQTWYATGPRMYIFLEFFTLLAIYAIWRGHVLSESRFKVVAALAIIAAMLSHREAVVLVVALPLAASAVMMMKGQKLSHIFSLANVLTVAALAVFAYALVTWKLPNAFVNDIGHGGGSLPRFGPFFSLFHWSQYSLYFERVFPYGLSLLPIAYFVVFRSLRGGYNAEFGPLFLLLVLTIVVIVLGVSIDLLTHNRLLLFILPLYILGACLGGTFLIRHIFRGKEGSDQRDRSIWRHVTFALLLVAGFAASASLTTIERGDPYSGGSLVSFAKSALAQGPNFTGLIPLAYGPPCFRDLCDAEVKAFYGDLRESIGPDDLIISFEAFQTSYYLGRVDGMIVERVTKNGHTSFDIATDGYFGAQIFDTPEEWEELRKSDRNAWIILNDRFQFHSSQQQQQAIEAFIKYQESSSKIAYVNFEEVASR